MPGVIGMNMMFSSLFGVGYVIVRYRKNGVLKRLKATPVHALNFVAAQAASRLVIVLLTSVFVFAGTNLLLRFMMRGQLPRPAHPDDVRNPVHDIAGAGFRFEDEERGIGRRRAQPDHVPDARACPACSSRSREAPRSCRTISRAFPADPFHRSRAKDNARRRRAHRDSPQPRRARGSYRRLPGTEFSSFQMGVTMGTWQVR
ncbi:MAG: ABC transporter permease [Desulfomicrobium escambiense]|nr:ABC transporter permease [Desulfomicrobium escambiense]